MSVLQTLIHPSRPTVAQPGLTPDRGPGSGPAAEVARGAAAASRLRRTFPHRRHIMFRRTFAFGGTLLAAAALGFWTPGPAHAAQPPGRVRAPIAPPRPPA